MIQQENHRGRIIKSYLGKYENGKMSIRDEGLD
jgi:hypothetical protein